MEFIKSFLNNEDKNICSKWQNKDLIYCYKNSFKNKIIEFNNEYKIEIKYRFSKKIKDKIYVFFYKIQTYFNENQIIQTEFYKTFDYINIEDENFTTFNDCLLDYYKNLIFYDYFIAYNYEIPNWLKDNIIKVNLETCEKFYKLNKIVFEQNKEAEMILLKNIEKYKEQKEELELEIYLTNFNFIKRKILTNKLFDLENLIYKTEEAYKRTLIFIEENKKFKKEIFKFKSKLHKYI